MSGRSLLSLVWLRAYRVPSGAVKRMTGSPLPLCVQLTVPWSTVRGHVWPSWSALMSWGCWSR